jgi:hypothetical protein
MLSEKKAIVDVIYFLNVCNSQLSEGKNTIKAHLEIIRIKRL